MGCYDAAPSGTSSSRFTGNIGDGAPRNYSTGIQYNLQGQLTREIFGTSTALYHRRHYNSRGQLFDVRLGTDSNTINDGPDPAQWSAASWNRGALRMYFSSNLIEYAWPAQSPQHNNGNLYRQDHFVPTALDGSGNPTTWGMSVDYFGYDSLNRVTLAQEETYYSGGGYTPNVFKQEFSYDRFGNRRVSFSNVPDVPNPGYKINGANNRLIAPTDTDGSHTSNDKMRYDQAGNLIKDTHTQTGTTGNRTYDAENRMLTADGANGLANSYVYDADGHRTRRSINNGGEIWWQVYGIGGELVAEYQVISGTPTLKKEYGYRNGQLLVIAETTGTCQWLVTDALGTPRMIADQTGSLSGMKRRDYLPFGEELLAGVGHRQTTNGYGAAVSTSPRQQFTGKERDSETGLDYFLARYYGSIHGRFTSPDEFTGGPTELFAEVAAHNPTFYAEIAEPQSLNKYAYCLNNPLKFVDPGGHQGVLADYIKSQVAIGVGKSIANVFIGMDNEGNKVLRALGWDRQDTEYYQPSNELQAAVMGTTNKELALAGLLGGRAPVNVMMAEGEGAAVLAVTARMRAAINKEMGNLGEIALAKMVGGQSARIPTPGTRGYTQIDNLVGGVGGAAHESKVGYISSVSQLKRDQVGKYARLLDNKQAGQVVYHFFRNPTTGEIGASKKVLDYLKKHGIQYEIHHDIDITK